MDGIVTESSINNINQRNEESSDESGDECFENGNNDDEATIITMYESRDGRVWSKISFNSSQGRRCFENIVRAQVVQEDLFAFVLILQQMFLKNF